MSNAPSSSRPTPIAAPARRGPKKGRDASLDHAASPPSNGGSPLNTGGHLSSTPPGKTLRGTQLVPCKFFRQGSCAAGRTCQFLHDREHQQVAVCKFFLKGQCKFGSKCALAHVSNDAPAARKEPLPPILTHPPPPQPQPPQQQAPLFSAGFSPRPLHGFNDTSSPRRSVPIGSGLMLGTSPTSQMTSEFRQMNVAAPPAAASPFGALSSPFGSPAAQPHVASSPPTSRFFGGAAWQQPQTQQPSSPSPSPVGLVFGSSPSEPQVIGRRQVSQQMQQQSPGGQQWDGEWAAPGSRPRSWSQAGNGAAGAVMPSGSFEDRFPAFSASGNLLSNLSRSYEEAFRVGTGGTPPTNTIGSSSRLFSTQQPMGAPSMGSSDGDDAHWSDEDDDDIDDVRSDRHFNPGILLDMDQTLADDLIEMPSRPSFASVARANLPKGAAQPTEKDPFHGMDFTAHPRANDLLCPFEANGNCRYGHVCRDAHGLMCNICHKKVIHPYNADAAQQHIEECTARQALRGEGEGAGEYGASADVECSICFEKVMSKRDPRFGLLNCDHAFCLACLRNWRATLSMDSAATHGCPLCRTVTHFITPSIEWVTAGPYKQAIIDEYRQKLSMLPCKYFNGGQGTCPFGTSCFYAHVMPDGTREQVRLRHLVDDEHNVRVVSGVMLSDFIVAADSARRG